MSKTIKWCFALPLTYILYIVIALVLPRRSILFIYLQYILIIAIFLFICKKFLNFDVKLFFTPSGKKFSFRKLIIAILLSLIMFSTIEFVFMLINPQSYVFTFNPAYFYEWILSLILIVLAALYEELLFRAYVAHFAANENPVKWKTVLASGLLFAIAHFQNPEVNAQAYSAMTFYFIFGAVLMLYYLMDNSIELPLGIHIGSNLVVAWFVTYPDGVLQTNALFTGPSTAVDGFIGCAILLAFVLIRPKLFRR